jgi:hypothetical protein
MSDPNHVYAGWMVDPDQRPLLLARFPARYPQVVAHHVTLKFGDRAASPPGEVEAEIVGEADDRAGVQALVVAIDGSPKRPDGGTFHITWSLGPGREAKESNEVIAERGWRRLNQAAAVRLIPKA